MLLQATFLWIVVCCLPLSLQLGTLASPSPQPETTAGPRPHDEAAALKDRDVPTPSRVEYGDVSTIRLPDSRITCVLSRAFNEDAMDTSDIIQTLDAAIFQADRKPQAQKLEEDQKWKVKGRKKKAQFSIYRLDKGVFTWGNVVELLQGFKDQYFVDSAYSYPAVTYITYNSQGLRTALGKVKKPGWFSHSGGLGNGTGIANQTLLDLSTYEHDNDDNDDYFDANEVASLQKIMDSSGDSGNATALLLSEGLLSPDITAGNHNVSNIISNSTIIVKGTAGDDPSTHQTLSGPMSVIVLVQPTPRPYLTSQMTNGRPNGTDAGIPPVS